MLLYRRFLRYLKPYRLLALAASSSFVLSGLLGTYPIQLFKRMDTIPEIADRPDARHLTEVAGELRFDDVRFRYRRGQEVLQVLFDGTIRENITYGNPDASEAEMLRASCAANVDGFVMQLPERYATTIGERGIKLSGGQRQRIAIARALLKNPRILILDEATSSIDTETERLIQEALDRLLEGRTSIVIAHRLSTIPHADQILVVEDGRILERGTHSQLLTFGGVYTRLFEAQWAASNHQHPAL